MAETIVGIGASAGGIDAFHGFFESMPADSGMAFVVILHLPSNRRSMLPEIIGRWTAMPVVEVTDGAVLEPNRVYLPPPHTLATIEHGRLRLRLGLPDVREERPIDGFFDSLAATMRENAIGIVLSGTGTDGALGLKAIRECGGFTLAQGSSGSKPQYHGMPSGAIATGAVDVVAAVEAMPGHLLRQAADRAARDRPLASPEEQEAARLEICTILRSEIGHDFWGYKDKTFLRRVQRRMQVLNLDSLGAYVERLRADHGEVAVLFRDLLIRVTSFFRDAETFTVLADEVLPRLFQGRHADSTVRVWVPGCATGEEAYSLAILLREYIDGLRGAPKVQIFATDIDDSALDTARMGRYPATLLEGLSPKRRARFFTGSGNSYVVSKEIREICTFSAHSLIRDPPFSRMNLVSCRNLLIYLDNELQARVIPSFHYALVPGGILLLGSSETTARHEDLFMQVNKAARIYERRDVRGPPLEISRDAQRRPVAMTPPDGPQTTQRHGHDRPGPDERTGRASGTPPATVPAGPLRRLMGRAADDARTGLRAATRLVYPGAAEMEELRRELDGTRGELRELGDEHRTAIEELRSANEELHSVNEELQSTVEELETSKEEIQSVNEELQTVNAQLSEKVDELDRTNSDLKNLFDSTEIATIFLDRYLVIRGFTPAVSALYNLIPSDQGRPLTDISSRLRYDGLRDDVRTVLNTLEPLERRVTRMDGAAHYIMRILPYRGPDSGVSGTLVTFLDVTSIVQAEFHQRLLVDELNHRVKNMLTVVVSMASQTLRRSATLDEFAVAFMGRVQALTASYTLLSRANWIDVPLREVLMEELRPFVAGESQNFIIEGPVVRLKPQGALAFGMAVHELVTNAVKYGALSVPEGRVLASWVLDEDAARPEFVFTWREEGGPPVSPPVKRGFGTTLIERGFAYELSGDAMIEFAPAGVQARLRAPLEAAVYTPALAPAGAGS